MGLNGSFVIPAKKKMIHLKNSSNSFQKAQPRKRAVNLIHEPFCEQSHAESVLFRITALNER